MTYARQQLGRRAEEAAAQRLSASGWEIVARNARTRYGEIDLVALDGSRLVFVEVKAGRPGPGAGPERPSLAVAIVKQRRLRRLAAAWLAEQRGGLPWFEEIRFDVVGVTYDGGSITHYEHIESAF